MHPSPLRLERHFFTKIHLDTNPDGVTGANHALKCEVEVGKHVEDPTRFQVTLKFHFSALPDTKVHYFGEIDAVGLFKVDTGSWPENRNLELVETNGPALLYGAIRELLLNLTCRGPWPPIILHSVTFVNPKAQKSTNELAESAKT